jgi:hypothetical protein
MEEPDRCGAASVTVKMAMLAMVNVSVLRRTKLRSMTVPPRTLTHPGQITDNQCSPIPEAERKLNEQLLKLEGGPEVKSKGGTTTSIWKKATYTKAVFSMAFSYTGDEVPSKENNWFLESNAWYVNLPDRRGMASN